MLHKSMDTLVLLISVSPVEWFAKFRPKLTNLFMICAATKADQLGVSTPLQNLFGFTDGSKIFVFPLQAHTGARSVRHIVQKLWKGPTCTYLQVCTSIPTNHNVEEHHSGTGTCRQRLDHLDAPIKHDHNHQHILIKLVWTSCCWICRHAKFSKYCI